MPGSSIGDGTPPALNPSAGEWPPLPGRYRIVSPTKTPARASNGSGHHSGVPSKPSAPGRSVNSHSWRPLTRARNPYAAAEIGTPRIAASISRPT
jgi:hypothetical protein